DPVISARSPVVKGEKQLAPGTVFHLLQLHCSDGRLVCRLERVQMRRELRFSQLVARRTRTTEATCIHGFLIADDIVIEQSDRRHSCRLASERIRKYRVSQGWPQARDRRPAVSIGTARCSWMATSASRIRSRFSKTTRCCITMCDSRLASRSEEHTSELQSRGHLVCRLLLEKKKERVT